MWRQYDVMGSGTGFGLWDQLLWILALPTLWLWVTYLASLALISKFCSSIGFIKLPFLHKNNNTHLNIIEWSPIRTDIMATFYKFVYYLLLWQYICQNQLEEGRVYFAHSSSSGTLWQVPEATGHMETELMGAGAQLMSSFLFSLKLQPTWILPSQRGASCLLQPNPESPS